MRVLKWLVILVVLLAAVFLTGGLFLPDRAVVERSVVIERPPAQVFGFLNGFARFNEWSPWRDYDPSARYEFAGPGEGVGAIMRWQGDKGGGSQEIVALEPDQSISVKLDFGLDGGAMASYLLRPAGAGTRLIWRFESDAEGGFVARWFNLLLDRLIGADYERGLASLKTVLEAEAVLPPPGPALPPQEPVDGEHSAEPESEAPEPADSD